uniref:Uncharacterized protein n=1 Tax=Lepeophtheirus salmonis TaxID=72036 RepID=A0A0K2U2D6_LEPSM
MKVGAKDFQGVLKEEVFDPSDVQLFSVKLCLSVGVMPVHYTRTTKKWL